MYLPAVYRTQPERRFRSCISCTEPRAIRARHSSTRSTSRPRLDLLIARHRVRPMILVMPPGSPSTYDRATEWANGRARDEHWFTYLTQDVRLAVDRHFRAIPTAAARGIGGYSSGADAAVNAILLRPHLYSVAEGWSGDYRQTPATVGRDPALVMRYSALDTAAGRAAALAATGAHVYLYAGRRDRVFANTMAVGDDLERAGVHTRVNAAAGGHAWALWSARLDDSLTYFSEHLAQAPQ